MKKLLIAAAFLFAATLSHAEIFKNVAVSSDVVVSTLTWTAVPAAPAAWRKAILVDNYNTNSASMLFIMSQSATVPTVSTTTGATLLPADPPLTIPIGDKVRLWAISLHTAAEKIFYQELK